MDFMKKYAKVIIIFLLVAMLTIGSLGLYRKFLKGR